MKKTKRLIALLMSLIIVLPLTSSVVFGATVNRTQAEAINWIKSQKGNHIDVDGFPAGQPYQCVDFIKAYYTYLIGNSDGISGNGKDYATNYLPEGFVRLQGVQPQAGDILVYGASNSNPYGHVGIYIGDYETYHQNVDNKDYVDSFSYYYKGFTNPYWGVIRPSFRDVPIEPTINWSTYDEKQSIGETNAVLAKRVDYSNVGSGGITKIGIKLFDADGKEIKTTSENVSYGGGSYFYIWYDINAELGVTLTHLTTYKYNMFLIANGKTYSSPVESFETKGAHSFVNGQITKEPTCTEPGTKTLTCSCGAVKNEPIPALDHDWASDYTIDKPATVDAEGEKSIHCSRCSERKEITAIPKLDLPETVKYGDVTGDGKIDSKDVLRLCSYLQEYDYDTNSSPVQLDAKAADCNSDGKIDTKDVLRLCSYLQEFDYETGTSPVKLGA